MIDTTSVAGPANGFSRPGFAERLRLQRHHQGRDGADILWRWIEADAFGQQRADVVGGMRLDHRDFAGIEALRQPARQHRAPHLAGAGEDEGVFDIL
jgi:hypothetical protein